MNANEPAFPMYNELGNLNSEGLTKREYFAAMAIASGSTPKDAISKADELLKLLNEKAD